MEQLRILHELLVARQYYSKSFEDFQEQFKDEEYQNKVYGVLNRDNIYTNSKEQFFSDLGLKAKPINEPQKKKIGTTDTDLSSEGGSLASTGIEILPKYVTEQPQQQVPYQFGMEPTSYVGGLEQQQRIQSQQDKEAYDAMQGQMYGALLPVLKPQQLSGVGPLLPKSPEEIADEYEQKKKELFEERVKNVTEDEIEEALVMSTVSKVSSLPGQVSTGGFNVPDYIQEAIKRRNIQIDKYIKKNEEEQLKAQKQTEEKVRIENELAQKDPEFASSIKSLNPQLMIQSEETAVEQLNRLFKKFGFFFEESGYGTDNVLVSTSDGKKQIEIKLGTPSYNESLVSRVDELQKFIYANAKPSSEMGQDFISNALKAKGLRKVGMKNDDGTYSTVLFSQKDNLVFPTLFPKKENYTSNPNDWIDFGDDWEAALAEAKKRGEVFSFKNDYEALRFADGGWKDVDETYLLGQKFYADRGLDYATERAKYDKFNDVQDEIDVLEKIHSGDHKEIPYSEKLRFSEYFGPDGSPLYYTGSDYTKKKHDALVKERDNLLEQVFDNEFMYEGPITLAREDFDVELEKKRNQLASQSVKLNLEAKKKEQKLSEYVQGVFGVPLKDIGVIKPKTEQEATVLDDIKRSVENIEFTKSNAASNYEESKLYLDAKYNKSLRKAYDDSWNSTLTQIRDAWERGQASEEILFAALGLSDVSDKMTREQIAKEIAERFANLSGEQTRVMTRYSLGRGGSGFKGFIADPAEMSLEVAATSLTQMLPYGIKLILGGGATGAATGAGLGFAGGPLAPATVTGGALVGAGYGARAGMSAAMVGMEYSNAIFDAMREKINPATGQPYDITNPKDVEAALLDTEIWDKGNEIGLKRGLTIGVIDFLAGGLAGRVFNVAKTAPLASRIGVMAAERAIFDPAVEGLGEFAAQVASGQDIDLGEIGLESIGGLGGQAPWMAYNLYVDARNNSVQAHAYTLATDLNALAKESTSDERIVTWTNNLLKLGKIDSDVSQRILENVGLRREARELLGTGTGVLGMKLKSTREAEARTMELLTAKKMLTSNKTKSDLFKDRISKIDSELQKIVDTGKVVPESERVQLNPLGSRHFETPTMTAPGVSHYNIDGTVMTRQQFLDKIENMKSRRLLRSRIQVLNDDETNNLLEEKLLNAFLEQKTGQVPVLAEARTGETVEVGTPQAELEDIAGEGVQAEETLTEAAPEQNETEAIKQDVVSSKTLLEDINSKIPSPIKSWNSGIASALEQGTLSEEEADSALSFLAEKVASKGKLSPQQKAAYDANKKRVDELSGLISQRNDLNTEVSELESILESRKATEAGKPKAAPDFTIDENVDAESANQVREIANRRKLGIPKNREVAFVARDKNGNVIGGAFRSLDKTTNKYSFDVAVSEEAEGRGVGSSLLDSVRNVPFEMRSTAPGATVEVDVVNPAMQQMLRRRGYVVTKRLGGDRVLMAPRKVKKAKVSPKTPEVVSAKNQTAVNELSSRSSRSRRNIIAQATRAVTVLSKILPDLEIFIHETSEEYNDTVSKLNGRENSAGNFAIIGRGPNQKLRIDINLSVANENTVAHEVAHAVMMKAFGEDVKLFKSFRNQISKILDSTTNEQLNQFASRYSEAESHEEFLVELAAVLSNNAQALEQSLVQKIANAINNVVSRITKGKIVPFSGAANAMQIIDFMNTFAPAMAEGSTIEILNTQNPYSTGISIRVDPNTFTQTRTRSKSSIGLYKFKSDLEVLKFVKLPTYSLKQVIQKYGGRVAIITSDATGYGVDSEGNPILGGFGYAQNKQNVEDGIGYASINSSTAVGTYTAARNEFGDNQKVLVLIMVQPPWTTINNSYGANYFFRGLLELANTSPEEFAKTKESMLEWIDSSAKMKEFVTTPELIKVIKSINIDGIKSKEELNAYREELTNKLLELTTFDVRKIFMKGVLFDLNTTGSSTKTTYSKIALRNIGYTIQNFLSEYGDNTTLTDEMYLNDEGGYVVGGFEINTMTKETAPEFIESMQSKGITHPLFNGKLPGTNHFSLDGLYGVQDNFGRFAAPNWEVDNSKISAEEVNSLVRKYYADDSFYLKEKLGIPLEERGYSELKAGTKTKFKETYMRPLGFLMPVPKKVDVEVARGLGFKLNKGVTPEQIAQAEFVARSKSQQGVISKSQLPSKKQVYQQSLDNDDINTLRRSLRRVSPNSYTMEILDEIQNAKKMSKTDRYYIEKNVDDAIIEYIDNGITLSDIAGMIYEDGIFNTAKEIDNYFIQIGRDKSFGLFKRLSGLKTEGQEVVSKSQQAVDEYNSASKENKDDIRSKSRVVIHDDTGFVSVDFWVENLMGKTKYLDKVIESILKSRDVLKSGKVSPERVAKSFLITIASKGSGGGYYSAWSNKTGKKVSELFLETQDGKFWIRPESAAAAYLATPEGDSLVKSLINKTATDKQIKSFVDFLGFGFENSKTEDILGTMNSDGINKMTSLFNQNKGTDSAKLYDGAIKYLRGIAEGKTGFFNQFIGVSGRGVVDARELNAWIAGQMKLTEEQKAFKQKVAQSKKLSNVILNRIEQVGLKLGYSEEFASYIAHHAIWDGIKNSVTTHEGIYDVISKSQLPVDEQVKSMSSLLPDELQTMQTIISTGRNNGFSDAAIVEFLKKKGFNVSDIMPQMQLNVDLFTTLPVEFANIEGGATNGMKLFADIRYELSKWVAAQKRNPTSIKFREEAQRILKNHPIYKKQSDSTKMSLQVSFDRSLNKKSDGQIQRRMDNLVNNIKQRKLAEKEFQQAKAKLANIIRSLLPSNEKIDVDALNKILNILSKSTANTIIKDIDTIVPLIEKQRQSIANRLVKDIKKTISDRAKTQKTASGKRRAKGIDEVGQAFFRTALDILKDILSNNQTKIDERSQKYEDAAVDGTLAELYRKQENNEDLTSQEQELLDEVTAFDLLRDINLMDIEQLNEVMNVLQTVNKEAIKSLKIKRLERSAEFDALNASANNQLRQMFPILFDEDGNPIGKNKLVQLKREIRDLFNRMKVWEGAKKAYAMFSISETNKINGFLRANISHLGTVCNSLDNIPLGFRFFTDNIYRPLNRAIERMLRGEDIVEDYLDAMANSITGITKGRKEIETRLYSMGAVGLETKKGLFNADELLRIYALSLNDIQRGKLDKMGWSANVIEEIKTKLGPEVIEYADMVVEYLSNDYYESVNNVYRYVFNANLNRISNYFPTKTIPTKVDGDMLKNGDFNGIFSADNASALKDRTDTSGEIDLYMGFTVALENHYKSMERFKAFAKTTQNINSIFRNESVIMLMNETGYMKLLRTHINYAINPDAFRSSGTTDDRAVSWFVRKFVGVALGLKVWQASKQAVSSFANAYEKYNYFPSDSKTPNVIKKSLDLPAFMVDSAIVIAQFRKWYNEAYEKSATFRNRAEKSLSGDVAGIESGGNLYVIPESKKTGIIARARRKFRSARGFFTAVGDLAGVLGYMVNYRRNILNGMDIEDAIEEFNEYNQMQQSDRPTEKAPLQQKTFWAARMMTLFGSSTILMINNIFQSWGNISKSLKAKKMPRSEDMRRFALAYGVSHALFVLISNFFALTKGDEEDKKRVLGEMRRALLGAENLKTIPWFGASYELVENKMLGIDRPVSQLNDPLLSTATKIYKGIDAGSIWQATKPIAEIVLGVSTDPIVGLNRMFSEGIDEDAMYDIIGISKSYRPGYGQKDTKAEEVMSKEDMKMMYPEIYESTYGTETSKEKDFGIEKYNSGIEEEMKRMKESIFNNK
jgi:ribosomal protein S18 acetylase RimI-like enzyme